MKTLTVTRWSLGLAVAVLPLAGGCVRESVGAAPPIVIAESSTASMDAPADAAPPQTETEDLENAPAKIVSTPAEVAPAANLSAAAAEIARLSQSGVDETVMLTYVNSASSQFALGSDQIIYLNDIGVPGNVVTAMIQRDQALRADGAPVVPALELRPEASQPPPTTAQDAPPPPPESNVTYTYFRDSLAPYGNWVQVEGYGQCWQPSVVMVDREWTPYCDRGHWVYSDCGWYWSSDYSWGWAPFHYGRWFRHSRIGWCWAPDTVWGPSWVSWRYNSGYCGWAPLPPSACFRPGMGFTYFGRPVGASFAFGLSVNHFTFVTANHFTDPHPFRHRVPHQQVNQIFNNTVIINPVTENRGNQRFHRGIPPKEITAVTHGEIKQVKIRETTTVSANGRAEDHDRNRGTLTVFRPALPTPAAQKPVLRIGGGVKAATPATAIPRIDPGATMHRGVPNRTLDTTQSPSPDRRNDSVPIFKAPAASNNKPPRNIREADRNPSPATAMETPGQPGLRQPAPVINTPRDNGQKTRPIQNNLLPQHQPTPTPLPKPATPAPQRILPAQPDPSPRDTTQRSQPRQEKAFIPPTMPTKIQSAPPVPVYRAPRTVPESQPRVAAPAPAPARPVPQVTVPRPVAPPAQVPRDSGPRPSKGDSRDKQDGNQRQR